MKIQMPHTFSIIFGLILICGILTWILPSGVFDRKFDEKTSTELVISGSYHKVDKNPQGLISIMSSFSKGLVDAAEVISYLLIVGGSYGVILKTGAIDAALKSVINKFHNRDNILIVLVMIVFAIGGTTTGMWEETLPFYLILIPLMIRSGYDPLVGISMALIGSGTGVMASTVNPFATGIASSIAGVSIQDGYYLRLLFWFLAVFTSICYVLWYANKIKKNPKKSVVYATKSLYIEAFSKNINNKNDVYFTTTKKIIVASFMLMIVFMMISIIKLNWWIPQMTFLFLSVAFLSAFLSKMKEKEFWDTFIEGSKDLLSASLVIGIARGILIVAKDGFILDTILFYASELFGGLSKYSFLVINEIIQMCIAFFVPSSSAHAALTISIMAPLADLLSVPRFAIVSSYQFASGLMNLITPTAGVLIAALAMGKVSWWQWVKFIYPLLLIQFCISITILILHLF